MADHYGSAEIIAGRLLARQPSRPAVPIAFTKWCPEPGPMTPEIVRRGVEERLDRLGVDRIDLLQFHWWTFSHPAWLDALHEMDRLRAGRADRRARRHQFRRRASAPGARRRHPARHQPGVVLAARPARRRRAVGALPRARRQASRLRDALRRLSFGTMAGPAGAGRHRRLEPLQVQALHRRGRRLGRVPGDPARRPPPLPRGMAFRSRTSRRAGCSIMLPSPLP